MTQSSNWNEHWEEESKKAWWQEPAPAVIQVMKKLDPAAQPDVLDLGCGIGRHALLFAEAGFTVTAADDSSEALGVVRKQAESKNLRITVCEGSYLQTLFSPGSFDLVIAWNVIYHGTRETFIEAVNLVWNYLKPDGRFFFTCPTRSDAKYGNGEQIAEHAWRSLNSVHPGDVHYFADEEDISYVLKDFSNYSFDLEEHHWDNNGTRQFSSTWQILAVK